VHTGTATTRSQLHDAVSSGQGTPLPTFLQTAGGKSADQAKAEEAREWVQTPDRNC
jgi:hypothetical protein